MHDGPEPVVLTGLLERTASPQYGSWLVPCLPPLQGPSQGPAQRMASTCTSWAQLRQWGPMGHLTGLWSCLGWPAWRCGLERKLVSTRSPSALCDLKRTTDSRLRGGRARLRPKASVLNPLLRWWQPQPHSASEPCCDSEVSVLEALGESKRHMWLFFKEF